MAGKDLKTPNLRLLGVQGSTLSGSQKRAKESIHTNITKMLKEFAYEQNKYDDSLS